MDPFTVQIISRARQQELEAQIERKLRARESGLVTRRVPLGRRLLAFLLSWSGW